ncbi:hypothetical protein D3C72_2208200 [compost metagenome]
MDRAEAFDHRIDARLDAGLAGHVDGDALDAAAQCRIEPFLVQVQAHHPGAGGRQCLAAGQAKAGCRAGDYGDLVIQFHSVSFS